MYTKLFSHITDSTVWQEDDHTRIVWITMLAMSDREGYVRASIPGLASRARVPLESTETALEKLASPDKYSQTQEYEGRRIKTTNGGWIILNYVKYREIEKAEHRREYMREYQKTRREKINNVNNEKFTVNRVNTAESDSESNTPSPEGAGCQGSTDVNSELPQDLHPLNYAAKILEELNFPHTSANMKVVAAAIEAEVRSGKTAASAYEFIIAGIKDAKDEGIEINSFFFNDARYRRENRRSKANGKESLAERNKRALAEYERRSK